MHTLIANTGIQFFMAELDLNIAKGYRKAFLESYDEGQAKQILELLLERKTDGGAILYYRKRELLQHGYIDAVTQEVFWEGVDRDRIAPLGDDILGQGFKSVSLTSVGKTLQHYENVWLPLPYFRLRGTSKVDFNAFNWVRCKLIPRQGEEGKYQVLFAVDTRAVRSREEDNECPAFEDDFTQEIDFLLCQRDLDVMEYCAIDSPRSGYIEHYLRSLVHPGVSDVQKIPGATKFAYLTTYIFLIGAIAEHKLFPKIQLCRNFGEIGRDVDLVVDIGNSRTTAILSEHSTGSPFSRLMPLELIDYSRLLVEGDKGFDIRRYQEPFDMRVTFSRPEFDCFGYLDSQQFRLSSIVRLGNEATDLMRKAKNGFGGGVEQFSYSSPKRYLWDGKKCLHEWQFAVTKEDGSARAVLNLPGITDRLNDDGTVNRQGGGGEVARYSRRSLMTFALLEILSQAVVQINSIGYRTKYGDARLARRVRRLILTCPTTMSQLEREALVRSARDAVYLLRQSRPTTPEIEILPSYQQEGEGTPTWYYDEASCAQLVYLYAELGYKYRDNAEEYLRLYGHHNKETGEAELTIGSIDIGAGTSDLMISRYTLDAQKSSVLRPEPLFYDSYYMAGDDMLYQLIREVLLRSPESSLRRVYKVRGGYSYEQMIKDCCGPNFNGQSVGDTQLRRELNLQVFVPVMHHFLSLFCQGCGEVELSYSQIFQGKEPSDEVQAYFERFVGCSLREDVTWIFLPKQIASGVRNFFEPLINKVSAIMYAYSCDVILLSGRPASLAPLRELFLRYYPVAPNRLISLNDYHAGDWYPFGDNTGYIRNPKTVVAVGALIGFYGSVLASFRHFTLDTSALGLGVSSNMDYVEKPSSGAKSLEYCFSQRCHEGEVTITNLPCPLSVRKIDFPTYPSRSLFCINYNEARLESRLGAKLATPNKLELEQAIHDEKEKLRQRFPLTLRLSRDSDNMEHITIESILDKYGEECHVQDFEVVVQSLGVQDSYWLDSGVFNF